MSNSTRSASSSSPTTQMPASFIIAKRLRQAADHGHRHVLDRTGGGLGDRGRDVHRAMPWQHDAVDAGTVAAAQQRAEVARIGDTVDRDQERHAAGRPLDERGEVGLGHAVGVGDDALRRLGARGRLESLARHVLHGHPLGLGDLDDVGHDLVVVEVDATQISRTRRLPAINSSRTAWRPSTCSPPSVLSTLRGGSPVGVTRPVRPAPRDENCLGPPARDRSPPLRF